MKAIPIVRGVYIPLRVEGHILQYIQGQHPAAVFSTPYLVLIMENAALNGHQAVSGTW